MLTLHIAAMKAKKHLLRTVYVENINDSLIGGGQIGSIKGMSSGSATLSLSYAPARFTSFADFSFSFFSSLWSYSVLNVHPIFMHLITFWS